MNYIIYQITNLVSGKCYVGCHQTANLDDGYFGSGKCLQHAINKYGKENFKKEVLHNFSTQEEMFEKEAEIVNEDFVNNKNTYNLKTGGFGGWSHLNTGDKKH